MSNRSGSYRRSRRRNRTRRREEPLISELPPHQRGLPNNKYGGHQSNRMRTYAGTFGAAGPPADLQEAMLRQFEQLKLHNVCAEQNYLRPDRKN